MEKKTSCECPLAGYCKRHDVTKSNHQHRLCQNHKGYFDLWEACKGPGQTFSECVEKKKEIEKDKKEEQIYQPQQEFPSIFEQGKNFGKAIFKHAASGFKQADLSLKEHRMSICRECPAFDVSTERCRDCGCFLPIKTEWSTSSCPRNKW